MAELLANRYELTTKVADGPIAAVWRGVMRAEAGFARPVAVRVLREPWDRDRAIVSAWAAAASELAERASPHVEQALDVVVADGRALVVSEWIDGISLRRWLAAHGREGTPVSWPLATAIAVEVLRALVSAHAGAPPICHEGIATSSVRLSRGGTVKVTRFGVAPALAVRGTGRRKLEELGLLSPSPELLEGESVQPSCDLFGVGALLFELLSGQPPFGAQPGEARDTAMRSGELTDLSSIRADVPPLVIAQIERALAVSPDARFESAAAMIRVLTRILQAEVEPSGPEAIAASVASVLDRQNVSARPQGLVEQPTMHVDLAELTVLPRTSAPEEETAPPEAKPPDNAEEKAEPERPQRYRFGYKDRRANIAARKERPSLEQQESEEAPLPLTRRSEATPAAEPSKPKGLVQHKTEFLDEDQVDRLTIPGLSKKPKGLAAQKTEFLDEDQLDRLTIPDELKPKKK